MPATTSSPWALTRKSPNAPCRAGGRVAGEAHARAALVVAVPEDHRLHIDRGAEVVGDPLTLAVGDGASPVPGLKDRFDRSTQLVGGVLREGLAGLALDELEVALAEPAQGQGRDVGVVVDAVPLACGLEQAVELLAGQVEDDLAVERDEAAVGVVGEAVVAGLRGQALHRLVVQTEVEDGVHHPRHRELRSRPDADQQRVGGVAQPLAHRPLDLADSLGDLVVEGGRPAALHVGPTGVGRDGEPRWHRQPQHRGHLGQVGSFAAEEILHLHRRPAVLVIEAEDVGHGAPGGGSAGEERCEH